MTIARRIFIGLLITAVFTVGILTLMGYGMSEGRLPQF